MNRYFAHMILLFVILSAAVQGERWKGENGQFSVEIEIPSSAITPLDSIEIALEVSAPEGWELDRDRARAALAPEGVYTAPNSFAITAEHREGDRVVYRLEPWGAGHYALSFFTLFFKNSAGDEEAVEINTPVFEVYVDELEQRPEEHHSTTPLLPFANSPLMELSPENRERLFQSGEIQEKTFKNHLDRFSKRQLPWKAVLLCIALCGTIYLCYRLWLKFRMKREEEAFAAMDPQSKALHALEQLKAQRLPEQGLYEPYYVSLSSIVRLYIEEQFSISAPELTTEEFFQYIARHRPFSEQIERHLKAFLSKADMVKFARFSPSVQECTEAEESASAMFRYSVVEEK